MPPFHLDLSGVNLKFKCEFIVRSAAYFSNGAFQEALDDGEKCIALKPDWSPLFLSIIVFYPYLELSALSLTDVSPSKFVLCTTIMFPGCFDLISKDNLILLWTRDSLFQTIFS